MPLIVVQENKKLMIMLKWSMRILQIMLSAFVAKKNAKNNAPVSRANKDTTIQKKNNAILLSSQSSSDRMTSLKNQKT